MRSHYYNRYTVLPYSSPTPGYAVYSATPFYYSYLSAPTTLPPFTTASATAKRCERDHFYEQLHNFRASIGQPIGRLPTLGFKELDLWTLYREVTRRHGIDAVIACKLWKEVAEALKLPSSCTDSGFRLRLHYKKYLEAFERKFYRPPPLDTPALAHNMRHPELTRKRKRRINNAPPVEPPFKRPAVVPGSVLVSTKTASEPTSASTLCSMATVVAQCDYPQQLSPVESLKSPTISLKECNSESSRLGARSPSPLHVDFTQLRESTLRRYARRHGLLVVSTGALAQVVAEHFAARPAAEERVAIVEFVRAVRSINRR